MKRRLITVAVPGSTKIQASLSATATVVMVSFADLARLPSSDVFMNAVKEHSVLSVGLAVGVSTVLVVRYLRSPWRKLPPGPSGVPILGNALQMVGDQWLQFSAWRKEYGKFRS